MVRRLGSLTVFTVVLTISSIAAAGGFEIPDNGARAMGRGGAYAAAVMEPSALYYNPAALSLIDGFAITVNANLWFYDLNFQRAPQSVEILTGSETTYPFAPVENDDALFPAPMLFISHDFGLEDWGFGFGVYGPPSIGKRSFRSPELETLSMIPNDDESIRDWGHGYMVEEVDVLLIFAAIAVAYDFGPLQLGLTFQMGMLDTGFTNGVDGGGVFNTQEDAIEGPGNYSRSVISTLAFTPNAIFGIRYSPTPPLTFSLSYRPGLVFDGDGEVEIEIPPMLVSQVILTGNAANLQMTVPDSVRFGARWAFLDGGLEVADIELDLVYEAWSQSEAFEIELDFQTEVLGDLRDLPSITIPKGYNDTLSIRLGGDVRVDDNLTVRAGGYLEGAANGEFFNQGSVRPEFANIDFTPFQRTAVTIGASYLLDDWSFDLGLMHVFSPETHVENGQIPIMFPLSVCNDPSSNTQIQECNERAQSGDSPLHAVNEGFYNVSYDLISVGFTYNNR